MKNRKEERGGGGGRCRERQSFQQEEVSICVWRVLLPQVAVTLLGLQLFQAGSGSLLLSLGGGRDLLHCPVIFSHHSR